MMTGRTLTLGALVALTQAKAIVTNNCPYDVYIWSVPQSGPSHTVNVPVKSGGKFEEAWRYGTATNPGIAIKISTQPEGISKGGDELDFAYSVAGPNKSKVWLDLSAVRGKAFDNNISFNTCHGQYHTADATTRQCEVSDDIELILCGAAATTSAKVVPSTSVKVLPSVSVGVVPPTPIKVIPSTYSKMSECYVPTTSIEVPIQPKVSTVKPSSTLVKSVTALKPSSKPANVELYTTPVRVITKTTHTSVKYAAPTTSTAKYIYAPPGPVTEEVKYPAPEPLTGKPKYPGPGPSPLKPDYAPPAVTTKPLEYPAPGASTAKPIYAPPGPVTDKVKYPAPEPTTGKPKYSAPIPAKPEYAPPAPVVSSVQHAPPAYTSAKPYSPPEPVDDYAAPAKSSEDYAPPQFTPVKPTEGYSGPSKPTYALPPSPSVDSYAPPAKNEEYSGPSKPTADHAPPHFSGKLEAPAKATEGPSYSSEAPHGPSKPSKTPPAYNSEDSYVPPAQTKGYATPPKPTVNHGPPAHFSGKPEAPVKPSPPLYTSEEPHGPPKHTAGHSGPPKATSDYVHPSVSATTKTGYAVPPKETDSHGPPSHHEDHSGQPKHTGEHHAPSQATASKSYSPPEHTADPHPSVEHKGHHGPPPKPTSAQYSPPAFASKEEYGIAKPTSSDHHSPPAHGPSTVVSKVYNAPSTPAASKYYAPVKEHGHGPPKLTSAEPTYVSPSPTGHDLPKHPSGKPKYAPEDEEEEYEKPHAPHGPPAEESDYPAPKPSKGRPQHPHSPPSKPTTAYKGPAHPTHAKATEPTYKTTIGKPYPSPPEPTYGGDEQSRKRASIPLRTLMQREDSKASRQEQPKACFSWFHSPSLPDMDEEDAEALLKAHFVLKGETFADMMNTNNTECPTIPARQHDGKYGVCMKPLCAKMGSSCSDLEDDLEVVTEALWGKKYDYTTDDDICV